MAKLKPQDFTGLAGVDLPVSTLKDKIIAAVEKRSDLSPQEKSFLIALTDYAATANPPAAKQKALTSAFSKAKLKNPAIANATQNDFSEIIGALILANIPSSTQKSLHINVNKTTSKLFIPAAGNYPLIDFIIRDTSGSYDFSVKALQKTTNVIKPGDVLPLLESARFRKIKTTHQTETLILKIIDQNSTKHGPMALIAYLYKTNRSLVPFKANHPKLKKFLSAFATDNSGKIIGTPLSNADYGKTRTEPNAAYEWWDLFEPLMDKYYANGKSTLQKTWKKGFYEACITVLCQYATAAATKNMNWTPFVDVVKSYVNYFKFGLNTDGTFDFLIENEFTTMDASKKRAYQLRAKSRISESAPDKRAAQDKLGLQP